jgi:transaldolase
MKAIRLFANKERIMQLFIDTANIEEIRHLATWGILDGVTTNPSLMAKEGKDPRKVIEEICTLVNGPISAEVISTKYSEMIAEAKELIKIHPNIVIKLPTTEDGLIALKALSDLGIKTNMTLIFSAMQALFCAKNGATYVSPFIGRLDDIGVNGTALIAEIKTIFTQYNLKTKILAASIRHCEHLKNVALAGSDVATVPASVLKQAIKHPLTDSGLAKFLDDYKKSNL